MNDEYKKLRDTEACKYAIAVARHYHSRIGRTNLLGEEVPFNNLPDRTAESAWRFGFDAAYKIMKEREDGLVEALEYYANHESVIKEAYHSNDVGQITVVHTFINHTAKEALEKIKEPA